MKKKFLTLLAFACLFSGIKADEGMWMLSHITPQSMKIMKDLGLDMSKKELYNTKGTSLKDAVVSFGGFCSGVIVSPDGLVFTNHHCGFGNIQALATPENDILKNGFVAKTQGEELPAQGLYVRILQRTDDVTGQVEKGLKKYYKTHATQLDTLGENAEEKARYDVIDSICLSIENDYAKKYPELICEVSPYYTGNAFYVNVYKQYDDIRLVFAPPQSLGKFGGETDNWMWPRQTCDFSVFRIYTDAENQPAEYSPSNRPMKAERYARISLDGYQKGDYCMTIGYPGRTNRYLSSYGIIERMENTNAARINVRGVKQEVWKKWMDSDPTIRLQYASKYASSSNYWKNSIGMNKALKELKVVEDKQKQEQLINTWIQKDKKRQAHFGNLLPELEKAYDGRKNNNHALCFLNESFIGNPDILRVALFYTRLQNASGEEAKETYKSRILQEYKDWNLEVDKETMTALIDNYAKQVDKQCLPAFYQTIEKEYGNNTRAYVDSMFNQTILTDTACVNLVLTQEQKDADMALSCLKDIMETGSKLSKDIQKYNLEINKGERRLCEAILDMEMDQPHYSDANSTMRLSYGFVNDYTGATGHQNYFTTMPSLLEKVAQSDKIDEYKVEPEIKALFEKGDFGPYKDTGNGEMQLCFLTNNDITGGNSGSPMFNGKGELIGLAFDGNWDAMSSDISFTQDLTRCIGVDIRYVLYIIDRWGGAERLLQETGVK